MTTMTVIRVEGHVTGPWAIGSAGHDVDSNIPVLQDPYTKRPVLPATSLVGALRAHLSDPLAWLGPLPPADPGGAQQLTPSRLWALGTVLDTMITPSPVRRTAIDGWRGAAAGTTLRSEMVVDAERTGFCWGLCHGGAADPDLLAEVASWRCEIGARRTIGLGRLVVDQVSAITVDLRDPDGLTWWLTARDGWLRSASGEDVVAPPGEPIVHRGTGDEQPSDAETWNWRIVDPLHVGTGEVAEDSSADGPMWRSTRSREYRRTPADGGAEDQNHLAIPGSAWKGIFRHRVSSILRSCGAGDDTIDGVVRVLFGDVGQTGALARRRGLLRFYPSVVEVTERLTRTHVAIDRISGGAAEAKLFSVSSVPVGTTQLVIGGAADLPATVRDLLRHVVLDLNEGLIGVGAFTTRGYGTVSLTDPPLTVDALNITAIAEWGAARIASAATSSAAEAESTSRGEPDR